MSCLENHSGSKSGFQGRLKISNFGEGGDLSFRPGFFSRGLSSPGRLWKRKSQDEGRVSKSLSKEDLKRARLSRVIQDRVRVLYPACLEGGVDAGRGCLGLSKYPAGPGGFWKEDFKAGSVGASI